jgi:hypothetical protein
LRAYGLGMTTELLLAICAVGLAVPILGVVAQRLRPHTARVRARSTRAQPLPVNRSIDR